MSKVSASKTRVIFWGVRGSIPTPGPGTVRYGGNTSCVEVRAEGEIIILDAGSGIRLLGQSLQREFDSDPIRLAIRFFPSPWRSCRVKLKSRNSRKWILRSADFGFAPNF